MKENPVKKIISNDRPPFEAHFKAQGGGKCTKDVLLQILNGYE